MSRPGRRNCCGSATRHTAAEFGVRSSEFEEERYLSKLPTSNSKLVRAPSVERPEQAPAIVKPIVDEPAGRAVRQHDVIGVPGNRLRGPALHQPPRPSRPRDPSRPPSLFDRAWPPAPVW